VTKKKRKKKKSFLKFLLKMIITIIILAGLLAVAFIYFDPLGIKDIAQKTFSTSNDNLSVSSEVNFNENVINIALIGIDKRPNEPVSRSDTIVILSYDMQTGRTMLTSIMRDFLVYIPDEGTYNKINASYAYGGEELLLKTLNINFDLNIKYYVTVDFGTMEQLVDAIGGIEVNVKDVEVPYINQVIEEQHTLLGGELNYLKEGGAQLLDGRQALAYSRIRKVGNSDWERTSRQRIVLGKIIDKIKDNLDIKMLLTLTKEIAPLTKTNIDTNLMLKMGWSYLRHKDTFVLEDFRVPFDNYGVDRYYNGIYYLKPNTLKDNIIMLHELIYGIDSYDPSERAVEISNTIQYNH